MTKKTGLLVRAGMAALAFIGCTVFTSTAFLVVAATLNLIALTTVPLVAPLDRSGRTADVTGTGVLLFFAAAVVGCLYGWLFFSPMIAIGYGLAVFMGSIISLAYSTN